MSTLQWDGGSLESGRHVVSSPRVSESRLRRGVVSGVRGTCGLINEGDLGVDSVT